MSESESCVSAYIVTTAPFEGVTVGSVRQVTVWAEAPTDSWGASTGSRDA
jgi:hypothetical protein